MKITPLSFANIITIILCANHKLLNILIVGEEHDAILSTEPSFTDHKYMPIFHLSLDKIKHILSSLVLNTSIRSELASAFVFFKLYVSL